MVQSFNGFTPEVHDTCFIAPGSMIIGMVNIGRNSSVWHNAVLRGDVDSIEVGESSNIQDCALLHCKKGIKTIIGNHVTVGHGAILHSCTVGDESLVGMGAIVLDNAEVGKNCIIAAGAVVTPNSIIPESSLVMGSPAKVKRSLTPDEIKGLKENAMEYVSFASVYMKDEGKV
ncbi:MAG TPA: gamma carbonic anhydrase family protein [Clostridia bacterium]